MRLYSCSGEFGKDISLVTLADDVLFSSFVNAVVTATVVAVEDGIAKSSSDEMPLIGLFGSELKWMFRDIIHYVGNYDELYYHSHDVKDAGNRCYNPRMTKKGFTGSWDWCVV